MKVILTMTIPRANAGLEMEERGEVHHQGAGTLSSSLNCSLHGPTGGLVAGGRDGRAGAAGAVGNEHGSVRPALGSAGAGRAGVAIL